MSNKYQAPTYLRRAYELSGGVKPEREFTRRAIAVLEPRSKETETAPREFLAWNLPIEEPKTGPLDFDRWPFQRELYDTDFTRMDEGVVMKGTQVGVSAWLVRWSLFFADTEGWTGLYIFPKEKQLVAFSNERVRKLIRRSPYLSSKVPYGYISNVHQKQVGEGFINYRGSQTVENLESIDADHIAMDEYDLILPEAIPVAEERISGSPHGLIRRVGVPLYPPGTGLSGKYDETDQRVWLVRCEKCRARDQEITFFDNVDMETARVVCSRCRKPLDVRKGRWVARFPDRDVRGYHVNRLIAPYARLDRTIEASKLRKPFEVENFYNRHLGLPYAAEENRLSEAALLAAQGDFTMVEGYSGPEFVSAGIDVASVRDLDVRISLHYDDGRKRALWIGNVRDFNDLVRLMRVYDVKMAVIDHLPEGRLARAFAAQFPGRVYLCAYTDSANQNDVLNIDSDRLFATVRRTEAIDAAIDLIRSQRNILPADWPEHYPTQMRNVYRKVEVDDLTGRMKVHYLSTGPDHAMHAEVYDLVASEIWLVRQQVEEAQRDLVQPLDDMLDFERSTLADTEDVDYRPGLSDEYRPWVDYDE